MIEGISKYFDQPFLYAYDYLIKPFSARELIARQTTASRTR